MGFVNGDTIQQLALIQRVQRTQQGITASQALRSDEDDFEGGPHAAQVAHDLHLLLWGLRGAEVPAGNARFMQVEHLQPPMNFFRLKHATRSFGSNRLCPNCYV